MGWGSIEAEPEVTAWLVAVDDEEFGQVERNIDLLADGGVHLGEPFIRQLRFYLGRSQTRLTVLHRKRAAHRAAHNVRQAAATRAPRDRPGLAGDAVLHHRGACAEEDE
jgi:hypothetical protein